MLQQPVFYLISGLAADERIFLNLQLEGEVVFLPWLRPLHPREPLDAYAERMAAQILPERPGLLVGVSFGGMVALEIAQTRPWLKVVQISSISRPEQMPLHLRLIRESRLYRLVPPQVLKMLPKAGGWFFGLKEPVERELFGQILQHADPVYMRWAIHALLTWRPGRSLECVQLIGTHDRVFPPRGLPGAIKVEGGTHLMVFSKAEEISPVLNREAAKWLAAYAAQRAHSSRD